MTDHACDPATAGPAIGILMLESRFPRPPGDIGNPATWPFPVLYARVPQASPERVVRRRAEGLLPAFVAAGRGLVAQGAAGIVTSCGFLVTEQRALAEALGVPVASSALLQHGLIERTLPPRQRCGVLSIAASSLTPAHLAAAGIPADTPIGTTEGGAAFTRAILGDAATLDIEAARRDVVEAARRLIARHPDTGAVLLECTNMAPYGPDVRAATGLPVHSVVDLVHWFRAGLVPPRF